MPTSFNYTHKTTVKVVDVSKTYFIDQAGKKGKQGIDALRNICLEIRQGECFAIIGPNGSGKSTLLKILSEITAPTSGYAETYGKVAGILEVGTGFNPDLSGRENVFLNARLNGMTRTETEQKFDAIAEMFGFAEFLDTPVKQYSSGMYMRLAFSVAIHIDADIYLFDEVLSVGDSEFQQKALAAIENLKTKNASVLIVTHNPEAVMHICDYFVVMKNNSIADILRPNETILKHIEQVLYPQSTDENPSRILNCTKEELSEKIYIQALPAGTSFELQYAQVCNPGLPESEILYSDNNICLHFCISYKTQLALQFGFTIKTNKHVILANRTLHYETITYNAETTVCLQSTIPAGTLNNFHFKIDFYVMHSEAIVMLYRNILEFSLSSENIQQQSKNNNTIGYLTLANIVDSSQ